MVEAKIINYKKALVEVDAVLSCLDYNEYKKIPRAKRAFSKCTS